MYAACKAESSIKDEKSMTDQAHSQEDAGAVGSSTGVREETCRFRLLEEEIAQPPSLSDPYELVARKDGCVLVALSFT